MDRKKIIAKGTIPVILAVVSLIFFSCSNPPEDEKSVPFPEDLTEKLEWWKDARFGMFIHWGPVSLNGTEIGWSRGRELSIEEYDSLYLRFNPVKFNANEWVSVAKAAGMKYMVLTTKHHDGFCLWDTKYTDYNIMNSPFARDVVKELSEACKKQGIAFGTYYSTCDWHHPDFPMTSSNDPDVRFVEREEYNLDRYTEYLKNQSVELIRNYGPLLVMWYDVPQRFDSIRGQRVIDHIRDVQQGIMVNDRVGANGDFDTPEQRLGEFNNTRPWETCMTIGRQWAYKPNEDVKSLEQCLHNLIRTVGGDGNLLFNVGPRPDGMIEPEQVARLKEMGAWLDKYGESVYETRGGPFKPTDWGVSTRKENKIFLHLLNWPEGTINLTIPDIGVELENCSFLGGESLNFKTKNGEIVVELDPESLHPINTVIQLEYTGNVMGVEPLEVKPKSMVYKKPVVASSNNKPHWSTRKVHLFIDAQSVVNGDWSGDFWHPAEGDDEPWLEIDLKTEQRVSNAVLYEWGNNIHAFELQYYEDGAWNTFYKGREIGPQLKVSFSEQKLSKIRLVLKAFDDVPGIYEMALF